MATELGQQEVPTNGNKTEENRQPSADDAGGNRAGERAAALDKILKAIRERQEEFLGLLSRSGWFDRLRSNDWQGPELEKCFGIIYNHLVEAQRLLTLRASNSSADFKLIEQQVLHVLEKDYEQTRAGRVHGAWEFAASLERMLLLLGDRHYLFTRLESEAQKDDEKQPGRWSGYLKREKLNALLKAYDDAPANAEGPRTETIEHLAFLYASRSAYLRTQRASEELKANYLNWMALVLTVLLLLLLEAIYISENKSVIARLAGGIGWRDLPDFLLRFDFTNPPVQQALVAAVIGALGGVLSAFYKMRDMTGSLATLRAFKSAMRAQPFVGATVGVLLMLVIKSGILAVGTTGVQGIVKWETLGVYCFIAGFSEPFFLGVVQRVAGAADRAGSAAADSAGGANGKTDKKTTP
jgi:hypothetical protein